MRTISKPALPYLISFGVGGVLGLVVGLISRSESWLVAILVGAAAFTGLLLTQGIFEWIVILGEWLNLDDTGTTWRRLRSFVSYAESVVDALSD